MRLAQLDKVVLADQRLAAGVDVHMNTQLDALVDDGVDLFIGKVQLVAVLGGPAASAMKVARAGWVKQDSPRDVALQRLAVVLLHAPGNKVAVNHERLQQLRDNLGVQLEDLHDQLIPVAFRLDGLAHGFALRGKQILGRKLVQHVHDLVDIGLGVFHDIVDELVHGSMLDPLGRADFGKLGLIFGTQLERGCCCDDLLDLFGHCRSFLFTTPAALVALPFDFWRTRDVIVNPQAMSIHQILFVPHL